MIAKCGEINAWHWAHESGKDCDPWFEGESRWHLDWKASMPAQCCEVVLGPHRADIRTADGLVVELQHSNLSPEEVREREKFYGEMVWIIDAAEFRGNLSFRSRDDYHTFRWKWPRKWMWFIQKPLFWDFGREIFRVKRLHPNAPCGGWGRFMEPGEFRFLYLEGGWSGE